MKTGRIVVVGGGWGGCAAALAAARVGAEVTLCERTDMLLGTGLVGGIFRNNGRFTAAEEMTALGSDVFLLMDACARHTNVAFPGHAHASLYDVYRMEPEIRRALEKAGVNVRCRASVSDIRMEETSGDTTGDGSAAPRKHIAAVRLRSGESIEGDAFVDATGTSATPANCNRYGSGCAMCILRCHTFLPRVSLTTKAGVEEWDGCREDGTPGAMSGSCKLMKDSLAPEIRKELEERGVCIVPIPASPDTREKKLSLKACQQYALKEFAENVVLLDTGPAKLMSPYYPLDLLRTIPGFENARFEDPIAGGQGNSMRYFGFARCTVAMQARGQVDNLFCAGERGGAMVGHTEAVVTGELAGHNSVRRALDMPLLTFPTSLTVGDYIESVTAMMETEEGRRTKFTFSGSVYFERMRRLGLYCTDPEAIRRRVVSSSFAGVLAQPLLPR